MQRHIAAPPSNRGQLPWRQSWPVSPSAYEVQLLSWLMLSLAIITEVIATASLKYTEGFTRLVPSVITGVGYASAFWFLSQALKTIPVSTAYAIWSGVGTATIAVIGIAFLGEPGGLLKTIGIALIIVGVVILNMGGNGH
jgi:small multidrug resistance pump